MRTDMDHVSDLRELVDIRDVKVDSSLPREDRVRSYLEQIKNPYCFRVGDVKVRVSYAKEAPTLDESFENMLASM